MSESLGGRDSAPHHTVSDSVRGRHLFQLPRSELGRGVGAGHDPKEAPSRGLAFCGNPPYAVNQVNWCAFLFNTRSLCFAGTPFFFSPCAGRKATSHNAAVAVCGFPPQPGHGGAFYVEGTAATTFEVSGFETAIALRLLTFFSFWPPVVFHFRSLCSRLFPDHLHSHASHKPSVPLGLTQVLWMRFPSCCRARVLAKATCEESFSRFSRASTHISGADWYPIAQHTSHVSAPEFSGECLKQDRAIIHGRRVLVVSLGVCLRRWITDMQVSTTDDLEVLGASTVSGLPKVALVSAR